MTVQKLRPDLLPDVDLPTQAHRVAADRAGRLAADHGMAEVLAFYDTLTPREQRLVFALLAKSPPPKPIPLEEDSPWWTGAELRAAHSLWVMGRRSPWVVAGHKLYVRDIAREKRNERRRQPSARVVGGAGTPGKPFVCT